LKDENQKYINQVFELNRKTENLKMECEQYAIQIKDLEVEKADLEH